MGQRVIHVGVGAFGRRWCDEFLKRNIQDGTIEVIGIVDVDPHNLSAGQQLLSLDEAQCFQDASEAFSKLEADFCTIAVPPSHHEAIIDAALAHGLDILCEKPIADTMEATLRIADKVESAGRRMAVTMSHRYDQDKQTLRRIVRSGVLGAVNSIGMRFQADFRRHMAWTSAFRHEMQNPLLIEASIHHLDILADLADSRCKWLNATTWKPDWAEFKGDTDGIIAMEFVNGVRAVYEGSVSNAVGLNHFYNEYVRVDGENGTAILNHRELEVFTRQDLWRQQHKPGDGQKIKLLEQPKWLNSWIIDLFTRWRNGGEALATEVSQNVLSSAMVFAAIESQVRQRPIYIENFLNEIDREA